MVQREVEEEKEAWVTWYIWFYSSPLCSWVLTTLEAPLLFWGDLVSREHARFGVLGGLRDDLVNFSHSFGSEISVGLPFAACWAVGGGDPEHLPKSQS